MWLGEFDCVSPEAFHSILGIQHPTFCKWTQQDAQEFLICVLNELHGALKKVRAWLWRFIFAFNDLGFHGIVACASLLNYMMWLLKTVIFFPFVSYPRRRNYSFASCPCYLNDNAVCSSIIFTHLSSLLPCFTLLLLFICLKSSCLPCPCVCLSLLRIH